MELSPSEDAAEGLEESPPPGNAPAAPPVAGAPADAAEDAPPPELMLSGLLLLPLSSVYADPSGIALDDPPPDESLGLLAGAGLLLGADPPPELSPPTLPTLITLPFGKKEILRQLFCVLTV
jgi:hypothetical protein